MVEHSLGKGEVDSSILSGSTSISRAFQPVLDCPATDLSGEGHPTALHWGPSLLQRELERPFVRMPLSHVIVNLVIEPSL